MREREAREAPWTEWNGGDVKGGGGGGWLYLGKNDRAPEKWGEGMNQVGGGSVDEMEGLT